MERGADDGALGDLVEVVALVDALVADQARDEMRRPPEQDSRTPGSVVRGGKISQRLRPLSIAFQADVPLGSLCHALPDRAPPTMSQRQSGRRPSRSPNKSSSKYFGGL